MVTDSFAELQIRWPNVPVVFCETRQLAEESTYRFLAAAHALAITEQAALQRISPIAVGIVEIDEAPHRWHRPPRRSAPGPKALGLPVPDRGRLRPHFWAAWHDANPPNRT